MPNYCKECQRYFETREALQQHLQDSSSKHPYCNYCDRIFPSSEGYSSHLTAKHTKCQICNRLFNSQIELDDHYLGSSRHPHCCGRGFVDDAAYRQHQQAVHQIRCRVCDRAFGSRDALEDHYRDSASHPICYDCNRGFMDDNAYYQHRSAVHIPPSYTYNTYVLPATANLNEIVSCTPSPNFNSLVEGGTVVDFTLPPSGSSSSLNLSAETELPRSDKIEAPVVLYKNLLSLIYTNMPLDDLGDEAVPNLRRVEELVNGMAALDTIMALAQSHTYRIQLISITNTLGIHDHAQNVRLALDKDQRDLFSLLQNILNLREKREAVLSLKNDDAGHFMTLIQSFLEYRPSSDDKVFRVALRLLVKLSEASQTLPTGLFIKGVSRLDEEARFLGGFADIYRASYQAYGSEPKNVALKRLRISQKTNQEYQEFRRQFCREALVWKNLQHPHILPFLGVDSENFNFSIAMVSPWMEHGTIRQYMKECNPSNVDINKHLFEVALGVEYLHSHRLVHGDLHATNILIDETRKARLTDFGLVGFVEATAGTHTSCRGGAVRWMAPELHDPESFGLKIIQRTPASDMFAFACVCIEVYTGLWPFSDIPNDCAVMLKVIKGDRPSRPSGTPNISDYLWNDIMEQCWKAMPFDRPRMEQVVQSMKKGNFGAP